MTEHRHHARLRLSRSRREESRQWQLRARQWPRRRGRADLGAGARALYRGRRTHGHGGGRPHPAGGADHAKSEIEAQFADHIETSDEISFDRAALALRARRRKTLHAITLSEAPLTLTPSADTARIFADGLIAAGLDKLPWSKSAKQWRDRVMFLRKAEGESWPDLSDDGLTAAAADWLVPALYDKTSLKEFSAGDLSEALQTLLPWELRARLEREAPTHFEAPTGTMLAIDYEAEQGPTIAVRLQELFGLNTHPSIARGKVPLVLELLSPAQRPVQVTRDLPGFWRGSYAAVRSDLRGRYPRHPWPEDPANALPTRRVKPRGT